MALLKEKIYLKPRYKTKNFEERGINIKIFSVITDGTPAIMGQHWICYSYKEKDRAPCHGVALHYSLRKPLCKDFKISSL